MKRASSYLGMYPAARILALLLWLALAVLTAGSVLAQEQPRSQGTLEEVIVTAQKRAENVQNVPIAMQAYNGETLRERGHQRRSQMSPGWRRISTSSCRTP